MPIRIQMVDVPQMDSNRLGALLLENTLVRQEDLERCLEIQQLTGGTRPLGEILVEQGTIPQQTLEELLALQAQRRQCPSGAPVAAGREPQSLLQAAVAAHANELILSEGRCAFVRVAGQLQMFTNEPLRGEDVRQFLAQYAGPEAVARLHEEMTVAHDLQLPGLGRGRIVGFHHFDGLGLTMRLHPPQMRSLDEIGLTDELEPHLQSSKGMILVAGEIRSGLTETLGALLAPAAKAKDRLVLVIDSDLELGDPAGEAVVVQRRIGTHTRDYASALKNAIGLDPDVIVVGDVGTPEVFELSLRAAEAGRLVIAGIRARSVVGALQRALGCYPARDLLRVRTTLASVLRCVVAIQLLPDVDHVKQVMATELLTLDDAVREVIREGALPQLTLLLRLEATHCGHSKDQSLMALLRAGRVRFEDAFGHAEDKNQMLSAVRALSAEAAHAAQTSEDDHG